MNQWDNDNLRDEGPLDCDLDEFGDDDEPTTTPCNACGAEIYEDSPQCPVCGEYISRSGGAHTALPQWVILIATAALIAFICYILF